MLFNNLSKLRNEMYFNPHGLYAFFVQNKAPRGQQKHWERPK